MSAFDGGARSPLALALVLPSIFASLAYSRARVLIVGAAAEAALGVLVAIGSPGAGTVVVAAVVLGAVIVIAGRQADFHQEWRRQLSHHSLTDPLTGLLNRRGFAGASAAAFDGHRRRRAKVALVLIDLDLFKDYNDVYGHAAGDDLLRWIGAELGSAVRPGDSVARLGGDEFAVLLPETDAAAAASLIERLGERLATRVPHCLGVATAPADGVDYDALYKVADAALYARKFARAGAARASPRSEARGPARGRRSIWRRASGPELGDRADNDPVAALALRPVHRPVDGAEAGLGVGHVALQPAEADAGGAVALAVGGGDRRGAALRRPRAPAPGSMSRRITANSSPPIRAATSGSEIRSSSARPTSRISRSPATWPSESLTSLKRSRSSSSSAASPRRRGSGRSAV